MSQILLMQVPTNLVLPYLQCEIHQEQGKTMTPLPKDTVIDVLDFLLRMKEENSNRSYSAIKNALHLFSISIPTITIPAGTEVYRMRRHDSNLMFSRIQDLGHRIDRNGILDFGRANEPLQSLFYCATTPKVAFCETSQLIRCDEKKNSEAHTMGIWRLQKDIVVANIPNFDNNAGNLTVGRLNEDFENYVSKNRNDDLLNLQYFLKNVGNEFATKWTPENNCYLITAAMTNYRASLKTRYSLKVAAYIKKQGLMI
ncbi:hypothetical protein [Parapedobacter sp. 2B3]|uniref:hypothetical protein n=1 Tax=Parapedobacter sp. 2B3 TaxID=3342381 RepID=UPI0035B5C9B1